MPARAWAYVAAMPVSRTDASVRRSPSEPAPDPSAAAAPAEAAADACPAASAFAQPSGAPAPLAGVRVVDLSQNLAGPFATQILADLGADVVKIEPPGGDPARAWGPPFCDGTSPLFLCANRNKRSVVLDLKSERGAEALCRLARGADVFVEAFRAGVAERLGIDYPAIRALREDVIYLSVTAFGDEGPLRDASGYDPLLQAFGGLVSVTGQPDGEPARVGTSVVDMGTGMWAALAVMAALTERQRTGRGGRVTASLLDTTLSWMAYHLQGYLATGTVPRPAGTGLPMIAPYQAFPTRDGRLLIAAGNDAIFQRLCTALELDELPRDARFASNHQRVAHRDALVETLSERTRRHASAELADTLGRASVPYAPIQDVAAVAAHEQVAASGMIRRAAHATDAGHGAADCVDVAMPLRWNGQRAPLRSAPPTAGEHTDEVLAELGL